MESDRAHGIELELSLSPEAAAGLWQSPCLAASASGAASVQDLASVYFDTADFDLARSGFVLRLRRVGPATFQTVKAGSRDTAGLWRRDEWTTPFDGDAPDLSLIPDRKLHKRLEAAVAGGALVPSVRTQVQRSSRIFEAADWAIRIDLDIGEAKTPKGCLPISALSLSLARGAPASLYDLALELLEHTPLRPASRTQAEAGITLLLGESAEPRRMEPLKLAADAPLEDVMAAVFASCVNQIAANEAPARAGADPEGIHQLRVAARRLRSALALFGESLPGDIRQQFRDELRWLAGELSEARDLDVFLAETLEPILDEMPACDDLQHLERVVRELRAAGYARARAALDSGRYTRLVLQLGAWLAGRRWGNHAPTRKPAPLVAPAREPLRQLLSRLYGRVHERGAGVRELSPEEAHRLRIQLKKLRYACEFLSGLYPGRRAARFVKRIARLQQTLGQLNDQQTAESILARALVLGSRSPEAAVTPWSVGFVSGWSSRVALENLRPLEKDWRAFARLDPFWLAQ